MTSQATQQIIDEHRAASAAFTETGVAVGAHHTDGNAFAWKCLQAGAYQGGWSHPERVTLIGGVHDGVEIDCQFPC